MEGKMKVLRLNAPKDLEYTEAPIPHPGPVQSGIHLDLWNGPSHHQW